MALARTKVARTTLVLLGLACFETYALSFESPEHIQVRTDLYGDPLPPGALARIGTARFREPGDRVSSIAFSPDGKTVAACYLKKILLLDVATGKELRRLAKSDGNDSVAFSPDGKLLASTVYTQKMLHVWDVATGRQLHGFRIWAGPVAFAPDGKTVAAGSWSSLGGPGQAADYGVYVGLWDVNTGQELRRMTGHKERVLSLCFCPTGKTIVSSSGDGTARLWDVATGRELRQYRPTGDALRQDRGTKGWVNAVALSPDGKVLAAGCNDGMVVRIWDVASGQELRQLLGHPKTFFSGFYEIAFSPDGRTLVSSDSTGIRIHWDVATGKKLGQFGQPPIRTNDGCFPIAFSPNGRILAGRDRSKELVCFWDTTTRRRISGEQHDTAIDTLAVSPDGKVLATSSLDDEAVQLWELSTGKSLGALAGHTRGAVGVVFAPDGKTLATGNIGDSTFHLWDSVTLQRMRQIQTPPRANGDIHSDHADLCLAFSKDSRILATGGLDGDLSFWDAASGHRLRQFPGHPGIIDEEGEFQRAGPLTTLVFAPDGQTLASRNDHTNQYCLWHVPTGKKIRDVNLIPRTVTGSTEAWRHVAAFSPNGRMLVVGGGAAGTRIQLMEVATGKRRLLIGDQGHAAHALALTPDGRTLATGTIQGTLHFWDVATGRELHKLVAHRSSIRSIAFTPDGRRVITGSADATALVWDVNQLLKPTPPPMIILRAEQMRGLWEDLASADAAKACMAIVTLASSPKNAVPFLGERLRRAPSVEPKRLARLVAELDSAQFAVRHKAARELEELGRLAVPALEKASANSLPLESRRRIESLLEKLTSFTFAPEELRVWRGLEALEHIGGSEAKQVLESLAQGAAGAIQTEEARAILKRLARRSAHE